MDYSTGGSIPIRCDWLDVTFPSESTLGDSVAGFLLDHRCSAKRVNDAVIEYRHPDAEWGSFHLGESNRGWSRISASGGSCEALRAISAYDEYLALLGSHPHTVTRLDAALDLHVPAPPVIQSLVARYPPDSMIYLTRKGVSPTYHLQPLAGGGFTGTFYAGNLRGKAKVFGRVYDKQAERASRGVATGPWLRYEMVLRKGLGLTLRDAQAPAAVFWKFASPALLNAPANVPVWEPYTGDSWSPGAIPVDHFNRLRSRVDRSVDLDSMVELADRLGANGRYELFRMLRSRLGLRDIALVA